MGKWKGKLVALKLMTVDAVDFDDVKREYETLSTYPLLLPSSQMP